jgi:hypothetical protein
VQEKKKKTLPGSIALPGQLRNAKRALNLYVGAQGKLYSQSACKSRIARVECNRTMLNFS